MSYKPWNYVVTSKLSKEAEEGHTVPKIVLQGTVMATGEDVKLRVDRLVAKEGLEPEDVEVSVNCPF